MKIKDINNWNVLILLRIINKILKIKICFRVKKDQKVYIYSKKIILTIHKEYLIVIINYKISWIKNNF
jgi:hypothetical protein